MFPPKRFYDIFPLTRWMLYVWGPLGSKGSDEIHVEYLKDHSPCSHLNVFYDIFPLTRWMLYYIDINRRFRYVLSNLCSGTTTMVLVKKAQ